MAYNIDVVKQGLYQIPVKVKTGDANYRYLQDVLFGLPSVSSNGDYIVMDYASRGIQIAKEAVKGADPTRVNYGEGFNEKAIFGLYFNDEDQVSVAQAENRVSMDEPFDQPWDVETRLAYLLAQKRDDIIDSHVQAFEKACATALLTGAFEARNGGTQSFPISSALLSVDGSGMSTNPVKTLTAAVKLLLKKQGARPAQLILNPDDAVTLLTSDAVLKILDNRRIQGNEVRYQAIDDNGAGFGGTINLPGVGTINVVSYFGGYNDANGNFTYYIPQGAAILAPAAVGCKGYCGVYVEGNGTVTGKAAVEHGVNIWAKNENLPGTAHVQVQSAPVPVITAIDRYAVLKGIA